MMRVLENVRMSMGQCTIQSCLPLTYITYKPCLNISQILPSNYSDGRRSHRSSASVSVPPPPATASTASTVISGGHKLHKIRFNFLDSVGLVGWQLLWCADGTEGKYASLMMLVMVMMMMMMLVLVLILLMLPYMILLFSTFSCL